MKYFTKEELEDITKELIENPTCETLKKLNEKYNENAQIETLTEEIQVELAPTIDIKPIEVSIPTSNETVVNSIPNVNIPNMENSTTNNNMELAQTEMPSFELPKLDIYNDKSTIQNNNQINFTGNLFDTTPTVANLMQTTDNFNSVPNTMPTTEVTVAGAPFFGPHIAGENNPIPVGGPVNNTPISQPSMFGQIEQNYM